MYSPFLQTPTKSKRKLSKDSLEHARNKVANSLYFIALLYYQGKEKEIETYLKQKGYNFDLGKEIEDTSRAIRRAILEQNPEAN